MPAPATRCDRVAPARDPPPFSRILLRPHAIADALTDLLAALLLGIIEGITE